MKKALVIAPLVATLLAGCSSMTTLKTENLEAKSVPKWYLDHVDTGTQGWLWNKEGMFYAVAEDVSPSMEMALKKATLKAKAKIADRVNGEMNNRTTIKYDEQGNPEAPIGTNVAQDVIVNLISESLLRTYSVDDKMIVWNPELRNYRAFVLMKISKKDVDAIAAKYDQQKQMKLLGRSEQRVGGQTLEDTTKEVLEQARQ